LNEVQTINYIFYKQYLKHLSVGENDPLQYLWIYLLSCTFWHIQKLKKLCY